MSGFRHNHYVPIWYQKRFMQPGQHRYYRLDLRPDEVRNGAIKITRKAIHHWAPDRLFAQDDLYTTRWGNISNTEIEQFFFGRLDNEAPSAVEFFCNFDHRCLDEKSFKRLMTYMSVQKLRTPAGYGSRLTCNVCRKMSHMFEQSNRPYCPRGTSISRDRDPSPASAPPTVS